MFVTHQTCLFFKIFRNKRYMCVLTRCCHLLFSNHRFTFPFIATITFMSCQSIWQAKVYGASLFMSQQRRLFSIASVHLGSYYMQFGNPSICIFIHDLLIYFHKDWINVKLFIIIVLARIHLLYIYTIGDHSQERKIFLARI